MSGEDCLKTLVAVSVSVVFGACWALAQDAQNPPPASTPSTSTSSSSSSAPAAPSERRFSGGAIVSFETLSMVTGGTATVNNSSTVSTQYQSKGAFSRFGYGLTVQGRLTQHFYLNLSGLLRNIGYQLTTTVSTTTTSTLNGISFPTTTTTSTHEDTRTRLIDIPLLLRYYGTGKRPTSPRWFLEAGGAWRLSNNLRTSTDTTDSSGIVTCCTFTPATPKHRSSFGMEAGAGMQFVDEFGIHVVPEVRYSRWLNPIFDANTVNTQKNEVEAAISLTF